MNKCIFILPYFGKFNNYFNLFLKSCAANSDYSWIVFTDDDEPYEYPQNVKLVHMTFNEFSVLCEKKFSFKPSLPSPYKLCDLKPAFGYLFEEYIEGYKYWGHCDCDLLFGDLNKFIDPLLKNRYDKIFSLGHMVVYRNYKENNRRFMDALNGVSVYKEAFSTPDIYAFDEVGATVLNPKNNNIDSIFRNESRLVFRDDLSLNFSTQSDRFIRVNYNSAIEKWEYNNAYIRCYWDNGSVISFEINKNGHGLKRKEYPYVHMQSRRMRLGRGVLASNLFEIKPDGFYRIMSLPDTPRDMHEIALHLPSRFTYDRVVKRFNHLLNKINRR